MVNRLLVSPARDLASGPHRSKPKTKSKSQSKPDAQHSATRARNTDSGVATATATAIDGGSSDSLQDPTIWVEMRPFKGSVQKQQPYTAAEDTDETNNEA